MKLYAEDEEKVIEILNQHYKGYSEWDIEKMTEDWLAEIYGDVNICGIKYDAATVLREYDPTAFRAAVLDFIESEELDEIGGEYYYRSDIEEAMSELEELDID